jgi:coproporphyrinogen III oxidase
MNNEQLLNIKKYLLSWHNDVTTFLQAADPTAKLVVDQWQHANGGGGITRVLQEGQVIEKSGINFSHVRGTELPPAATLRRPELAGRPFQAVGVSIIVHPLNPYAPTTHANLRFFLGEDQQQKPVWWFGGGFDLTPFYGFAEDCQHWHQMAATACDVLGGNSYERYKQWADEYFYLKHRQEARGIGGLFFDDLCEWDFEQCFAFIRSVAEHFIKGYQPILNQRKTTPYQEHERDFQLYRRGRYVEFNLIYDRGTLFGLQSGGRTESILASLPTPVVWRYNWQPEANSKERELTDYFLQPRDWLNHC